MARIDTYTPSSPTAIAARKAFGIRELLTAARTYYVATTGSDSNDGLSVGTPFATIQHAVNFVSTEIDLQGYEVTIQVSTGVYNENVTLKSLVGGNGKLLGDTTTPTNVVIKAPALSTYCVHNEVVGNQWAIKGFSLDASNLNNYASALSLDRNSVTQIAFLDFKAIDSTVILINVENSATLFDSDSSDYTIHGAAWNMFIFVYTGANVNFQFNSLTINDTPTMNTMVSAAIRSSVVFFANSAITGTVTGKRYSVSELSIIDTFGSGVNYIPGTVAGTADGTTGGFYA
jgi:hypothetical protein